MATNIEQIFRSFVVSKFREIQEEQQQQQHGGGKVEGQPNGDTIPSEQANPSDDTGAGSRQNDQIVQKIEEVLSGALDTELQCKSDVDKNTVKNSAQSTKRSSTAEDEIPKKKSKKNKKHKSKKKKKKKKKRKKEKKHKKQPKESKLSTHHGDQTGLQPASQLIPEKSSSQLTVQHGGFGDANLSVHLQPEELCLKANEELDRQALGLVSHSGTDSQQSVENLGNEKGTLCETNPPFRLESSQSDMQENASITLCTREEQIKQTHENICSVAINASEKSILITGNDTSSSILSGVANESEMRKDSAETLASEVSEVLKGSEVMLKCEDTRGVKALYTTLESETMEVLKYSETSLQSVAQWGAQQLEATSESASLASDVTTIPKSADMNTVKVAHVAVTMEELKIPEATEKSLHMGSVRVLEEALQPVAVLKPQTSQEIVEPLSVTTEDVTAVQECLQVEGVKDVEHVTDPASVLNASEVLLQPKVFTDTGSVDRTQESALPAELTDVNVITGAEHLRATLEPVAVMQTLIPETTPEIQMAKYFRSPQATTAVAPLAEVRGQEISEATLQLENTNASEISNVRDLKATTLSLQKEDVREDMAGVETDLDTSVLAVKVGSVKAVKNLETAIGPVAETERKDSEAGGDRAGIETKASSSYLHMKDVRSSGDAVSVGIAKVQALEAVLQPGALAMATGLGENVCSEAQIGSKVLEASPGLSALEEKSGRTPESLALGVSMEPVAEMMHLKTTAQRDPNHAETGAEPLGASKTESFIISQSQVMTHTRTSQAEVLGEIKDSELATSSATAQVRGLGNLLNVEDVAELKDVEMRSKTSHLTQMVVESETKTLMQGLEGRLASEAILEPVKSLETSSGSAQEQIGGCLETECLPRIEEKTVALETVAEITNLRADEGTQGPTVEYIIASKRTSSQKNEPFLTDAKDLEEASETEKAMGAQYLDPVSKARETRLLESMKETATVEVKGFETAQEPEMQMDIQGLETLQQSGNTQVINVGDALEAVPESLQTEKQGYLQAFPDAKPAPEWKSTEEAPEIFSAAEVRSSETVSKPDLEATLEQEVAADAQYAEEMLDQQMEDVRIRSQSQECKILLEKEDTEHSQASASLIAETDSSFSRAVDEKDSSGTSESEIIRDTNQLEAASAHLVETQHLETAPLPETAVELKDAEAPVTDLEAAPVPEIVTEAIPVSETEESQMEIIPQAKAIKEATPEQESEKRDSETSDVQPDVAARMKETLMRLEKVIEKSSHRASDKKHDAKKQKRSRSKSQSRSRKRKKKSRSRSTSRRLASKRARSRSRNYSVSRKKRSKSRSPSLEKSERRLSSRRSRRRRSVSSDRYRSKSRSAEKRGSRLSSGRSRHRRSRSSDHYRSKSRSVEKRLSSRRSRRRRSRSSDRYRSKSRSVEKRLSSRRSGRRRSRSSDRYRSKSRSVEKRLSSRRSGRRRSRSSDHYRSKSRSVEKRLSSRRSGRRRSRSSDRYRSKSRSAEKQLSSRRSGRRRSRSSDRYRSKSRSVEKRGSRLSSWRSRRRRSRSSDRSKSRSRSSEKRGGKEYSWRFRNRGSGSSDRSKSRSRSVEKRGRKASVRRSKRQRSKSSDRYKSKSRSVEKRDRKQSSRKSKRQRSKSSDGYKSRSKSVEKKKESSRKSKRRRSKSSEQYKSRSRSVEKKRKESSKKSKRKRSKSSDSIKSRSKSIEKIESTLSSEKGSGKHVKSSELQESSKCLEKAEVSGTSFVSEGSSSKSSNGPMSVSLSDDRINGPELPPASESNLEKTPGLQPSVIAEFDSSKSPDDQESTPAEKTQVSEPSMMSDNASAEKTESSALPELTYSTSKSRSSSVEKGEAETSLRTELQLTISHEDESRSTSLKEVEGPEPPLKIESGSSVSLDNENISSSGKMGSSLISESTLSDLSDGRELRHMPAETTELQKFLQVPESESSKLADGLESRSLSFGTEEVQKPLAPEVTYSLFSDDCESASLPIETGQMQEPSLSSDRGCFRSPDGHELGSSFAAQTEKLPLLSEDESFKSPDGNEQRSLFVEKVKASDASLTYGCAPVEISDDIISPSSEKMQEVVPTTAEQSCKSCEVHESSSCVDKDLDGPKLSQAFGIVCSESSEMHVSGCLLAGKTEDTGSVLSVSGIPVFNDSHNSHNYFENTESAELSLASAHGCSVFPEGYKVAYTTAEKLEIQKPSLTVESELPKSNDICESVSTSAEKQQTPLTSVTSEGELFLLPASEECRPIPDAEVEVQETPELKCIASLDGHKLRSAYDEEIEVQEPPVLVESRCSVSSDACELTSTAFEKVDVEEPSQIPENEYTVVLDGPELTSAPTEKTEMQELYQMSQERHSVSVESQELGSPSVEKTEVQEPAVMSENEYGVSWEINELRSSSPEKAVMQEASVVPDNEYAVSSEDNELLPSIAEKAEAQECSLQSENEYAVSPEGQEMTAEKELQQPSLVPDSAYTVFSEGQRLQSTYVENTVEQEPSLVPDSQYVTSSEEQELHSTITEKTEVQECSLLSENEYDVSLEGHDLRSSPLEKGETEEPSEPSESESSMSTDSQELQSTVIGRTEVQELSLMSEGECAMSPEEQDLQTSCAENVEAKEPCLTSENEGALSHEYEPKLTQAERAGDTDALTCENDLLSFKSQEISFTTIQNVDVQELSPRPENEHTASFDGQEMRFPAAGKVGGLESSTLNERASMSHDDLKSIPVEKMDDAMPSLMPESGCSMSPDGYSVKSCPGEETGDLEPPLISERRHSISSYQEGHELKSPVEEEGLESLNSDHRRSVSPEGHDQKSTVDEEIDDKEPSLTSEHRCSTSPDEHESRSSIEEAEYLEQPLTTERRCSVSSDEHESRSTTGEEVEDAEPSLTAGRRDSISSDEHESRSTTGEDIEDGEPSLTAERRHSTSSDDHESRSTTGEETEDLEPLTADHRRSVSPDGCESRSTTGEEAEDQELSLTAERRHSTSSEEHESRSTIGEDVEDMEPSSTAERRDSTSSDERESQSTTGEEAEDMEPPLTTEHRRSTSPDGRESRSTTGEEVDDGEPSLAAERRDSTSSDEHESRSTTGEEGEDVEPSLADEDKQDSMPTERLEEQDSSFIPESRHSESSEREKSRSKSVDQTSDKESSQRSVSRHSKSPTGQKSRSTSVEKAADRESSQRSRRRRSRSAARQKSRSTSVEKTTERESSRRSRHRRSRSIAHQRSRSTSVEKATDKESSRRSRRRRSRSTARQRSQSKSVEKTADKESSRRSRSRRSRSSQRRSQRYDTESHSRRNRSRSVTRRRASRSRSNRRSRSSSLSRSRHRRRSRSRSASRRRRSLSRDRRKRSQRNRSRSTDRRRRRSDSRDRRISLRLRSRSRSPIRQRRSRSRGRRRSSSRSPIRLRRSRSSGRRRYSRSPDRRRSRSSERFSSRSPKRLTDLDKAQLLEIAKANAAAMCAKSGVPLPPSLMPLLSQKKDEKATQKSSRDTLKELTEKCKKIAQSTDDVIVNKPHVSDEEEEERPFYNHPFKLSEPKPIFFNLTTPSIKPAPPPQPKNQVSLSKEFPVSSGSQHRKKEADSVYGEWVPVEKGKEESKDDVFPKPSIEGVDITTAMNDRALAQKRLNENTFDLEAMCMLNRAQEQIDAWAQSNSIPGQFTGSTGAQILSSDELTNSGPQAWIRKDQFLRAAPVTGGMGAQLMRKMGWREGEGLGKNKEGSVEPIMVDFKTDRKGLVAVGEKAQKRSGHYVVMKDLSGKHPVSALMEICNKRRWSPPEFVLVDDSGPDHRKHFIFKVRVNGNEYRPTFASLNKKHAKATAATAALQAMGLVPKESMVNTTMFRSASHR
ncbi:protein SON [Pogoniulus pusillus]|uniref:protein SON n=1 Tax=Pogoniulus pusillus TaxID=488313 RepID=UPI0030B959BF